MTKKLTVDEKSQLKKECEAKWDKDPAVRKEFSNNFDAFYGYSLGNSQGRIRKYR